MKKWYKLDNAAKIFPPCMDKNDTKVFRFSVSLKKNIDETYLKQATEKTLKEYPIFRSVLKKGLFWYYIEESDLEPKIEEEKIKPCTFIEDGLLFRINYYKKRINFEVSHVLTDGTGSLMFFKSLVINYLNLVYNLNTDSIIDKSNEREKSADSFSKYKDKVRQKTIHNNKKAFRFKGELYPENNAKIIEGKMSTKALIKLTKEQDVSLTIYLTSLLIKSIGDSLSKKERKKPIVITIPVNLRSYYPSSSVRNFFTTVNIPYYYDDNSIEDIIKEVSIRFKENLAKENIDSKMNGLAKLEDILIIRVVPNVIKDFVLKTICKVTCKYETMTLSNIGKIDLPDIYQDYVEYFDAFMYPDNIHLCTCSYLDNFLASFTTKYMDHEAIMNFFRELKSKGIEVEIFTNKVGEKK